MIFNAYSDTREGLFDISINSAGHIFAEKGRKISRPNGRDDWLVFYVAKGREHFAFEKNNVAEEGSFIIFKPREPQEHIHLDESVGEFYYIHFNAPESFDAFEFESSKIYSSKASGTVRDIFEKVIEELQTKRPFYEKLCISKLFELFCELSRRVENQGGINRAYFDKIAFAVQLMNREYAAQHTLEDYSKVCNMSKFHFLRVFKEITGSSPIDYKNNIRMEHARELLEDTNLPISEIGTQVGFSSPAYFSDAFKRRFGASPAKFRAKK